MSQTKTLNIVPDDSLKRIHLSQGDLGRTLIFKLFEGSASYSPPAGATVKIVGTKPSGVGYSVNGTFSGNTVTIVTTSAMTDEHGAVESELIVTNQSETEIFKSANFLLMIEKDPHPAGTVDGESSVVVPTLLQLQSAIGDLTQLNTTDKTSLVGAINEVVSSGSQGDGLTNDIKEALLECFEHVAWIDEDGQDYYDALHDALYPPANLTSITCVYTQSGTVYDTDSLDDLKSDLVVTAHYDDSSTQTVTTYTLSGTLTEGTSTITVSYGGKTTTFSVTVTHYVQTYVTSGLIHWYDGINNTQNGHDATATTWTDLVGTNTLTMNNSSYATWETNALNLVGTSGQWLQGANDSEAPAGRTMEVCVEIAENQTAVIAVLFSNASPYNGKVAIYSDNTFGVKGCSGNTYTHSGSDLTSLHHIASSFSSENAVNAVYANGSPTTTGSASHSMSGQQTKMVVGQQGATTSGSQYPFKGKIYSIRIYDRILTDAEIAQNYAVDVSRFGLGG